MVITINNHPRSISTDNNITVQQLLDLQFPHHQKGIAVAVNQSIVPRLHWKTYIILPNDDVLIITATQGG